MKTHLHIPGKIYRVGGAVRDELLHYPSKETDYVVVGATPEEMLAAGFLPVGKSFPVFLHPKTKEEYALARSERKTAKGYHGFEFYTDPSVTLEEDLKRRDLTINAMAMDDEGKLFDPYGGKQDLDHKLLRHVSDAFVEDPVRILRIARFAARFAHLGFTVAPETLSLMKQMVEAGEVDALVAERVWKESEKALEEQDPEVYISVLRECGALKLLMPELNDALNIEPTKRFAKLKEICSIQKQNNENQPSAAYHPADLAIRFAVLAYNVEIQSKNIPPTWRIYPELIFENRTALDNLERLNARELLDLLNRLDVFRREIRFEGLAKIISVWHGKKYADILRNAYVIAAAIEIAPLIQGRTGIAVFNAIDQGRLKAIDEWMEKR